MRFTCTLKTMLHRIVMFGIPTTGWKVSWIYF